MDLTIHVAANVLSIFGSVIFTAIAVKTFLQIWKGK